LRVATHLLVVRIDLVRSPDLREELVKDLTKILGHIPDAEESVFRSVVLLDDLSASGLSYIRKKKDGSIAGSAMCRWRRPLLRSLARRSTDCLLKARYVDRNTFCFALVWIEQTS
jgi:hypothetical protein